MIQPKLNTTVKQGHYLPFLASNLTLKASTTETGTFTSCTGQQVCVSPVTRLLGEVLKLFQSLCELCFDISAFQS